MCVVDHGRLLVLAALVVVDVIIIIIRVGRRKIGNRDPFTVVGFAGGLVVMKGVCLVISIGHEWWWWWWTSCCEKGLWRMEGGRKVEATE